MVRTAVDRTTVVNVPSKGAATTLLQLITAVREWDPVLTESRVG